MLSEYLNKFQEKGEVYLRVKAAPGSVKTMVKQIMDDDTIKIDVAAAPEKGRANHELTKYLAKEFAVNKNNIKIISGAGERIKLIKVFNK